MKARWKDTRLVIADEFSMYSAADLFVIDRRLKIAKSCDEDFGGIHIICGGDFLQVHVPTRTHRYPQLIPRSHS